MTDFGSSDYFVASMKGVILSIAPGSTVVDVTHEIPPFNVIRGAFVLWKAYKWFPPGTVFVAVVDPGVGSSRRAIALEGRRYYFVGPDNGVLSLAAEEDGLVGAFDISGMAAGASSTFHGRDVFAPAAARISRGEGPSSLGKRVSPSSIVRLELEAASLEGRRVRGRIIYVDRFGNAFTNFVGRPPWTPGERIRVELKGMALEGVFASTYSQAEPGGMLALINSEGHLELAIREGNLAKRYDVSEGDAVSIGPAEGR